MKLLKAQWGEPYGDVAWHYAWRHKRNRAGRREVSLARRRRIIKELVRVQRKAYEGASCASACPRRGVRFGAHESVTERKLMATAQSGKCVLKECGSYKGVKMVQMRGPGSGSLYYAEPVPMCAECRKRERGRWAYPRRRVQMLNGTGMEG